MRFIKEISDNMSRKEQKEKYYRKQGYEKIIGNDGRMYWAKGLRTKNGKLIKGRIVRIENDGHSYTATWKFKGKKAITIKR